MDEVEREYDIFIIDATYRTRKVDGKDVAEVHLFGLSSEADPVCCVTTDFEPYFFVLGTRNQESIRQLRGVTGVSTARLWHGGKEQPFTRVTTGVPRDVSNLRKLLERRGEQCFAADILYGLRFLYDCDIGPFARVKGRVEKVQDGTVYLRLTGVDNCKPFQPRWLIASVDIENSIKTGKVYCISLVVRDLGGKTTNVMSFDIRDYEDNEADLLEDFRETLMKVNPDIITGYNIWGYDLPQLSLRYKLHGLNFDIGRDRTPLSVRGDAKLRVDVYRCAGRAVIDTWLMAKYDLRPLRETLDFVSKSLGLGGKDPIDASKIDDEWAARADQVVEYCNKDAELVLDVLDKIGTVPKAEAFATMSGLPLDMCHMTRASQIIDSVLIRKFDKQNVAVPCMHYGEDEDDEEAIQGGHVFEPVPGLHKWVAVLDFKSMYPTQIIKHNICYTTHTNLPSKGGTRSPVGAYFLSRTEREGLLPAEMRRLWAMRDEFKRLMKEAQARGDEAEAARYGRLQEATKILMNSFYGVFASSFYRFTNKEIGASVTAFARESITKIAEQISKDKTVKLIYGDTDSIFVETPYKCAEDTERFGKLISDKFSTDDARLDFEKVFERMFITDRKKRYVGMLPGGKSKLVVRGFEVRRGDTFPLLSEMQSKLFDDVLTGDPDTACRAVVERLAWLKTLRNKWSEDDVAKLVITKNVRPFDEYQEPGKQPGVRAIMKLKARTGLEWTPGTKVSWYVSDSSVSPQDVEPWHPGGMTIPPDWDYYIDRVVNALSPITEAFGWNETALRTGQIQQTLEV